MAEQIGTRRDILKTTAALSAAAMLGAMGTNFAHAQASDKLRVGLIGCGRRGGGAARDCVNAAENVEIAALGDLFPDNLAEAKATLANSLGDKFTAKDDHCFSGWDAYQKVLATDVDLVLLTTPPGFRAMHIRAALEAGKHVFAEKPVAVDATGVRSVLESAEIAKQKKLSFVTGTQRRHMPSYIEVMKRIHDGAIGEIVGGQCYWNQGYLRLWQREKDWSDMEWQVRNWLYFTWLSGDHIVEQHIHNIDVMNWALGGPPKSAYGMGGRQVRTDPVYGHIFDHFTVEFEYSSGQRVISMCRQIDGTDSRIGENIVGTKGSSDPRSGMIFGENSFNYTGERNSTQAQRKLPFSIGMHQEHVDLISSIRKAEPLNEGKRIAETTLTAIMGRMSAYTGKTVTWEQAMNSKLSLMPAKLEFGSLAVAPVATPGKDPII